MILNKAEFRNFRILKNVEIDFSTDENKPLRVIRAENESGKTTMLRAIQWGLFGDQSLPTKGRDFRIHPLNWNTDDGDEVNIAVEIDFTHTWDKSVLTGKSSGETVEYKLLRTAREKITGKNSFDRSRSKIQLHKKKSSGYQPVPNPKDRLKMIMGSSLKDLFFTDGDDALRFITSTSTTGSKRKMVQSAIRDMLSVQVIEDAIQHVKTKESAVRGQASKDSGSKEVQQYAGAMADFEKEWNSRQEDLEELSDNQKDAEKDFDKWNKKLEEALKQGDKETLVRQQNELLQKQTDCNNNIKEAIKAHSNLFSSSPLYSTLTEKTLITTQKKLDELKKQGKIPRASLPYLNDLLKTGKCLCGTKLSKGHKHYDAIKTLIEKDKEFSNIDDRISELKFSLDRKLQDKKSQGFLESMKHSLKTINRHEINLEETQRKLREIETEIGKIPDTDISEIRDRKQLAFTALERIKRDVHECEYDIVQLKADYNQAEALWKRASKIAGRAQEGLLKLKATTDVKMVLEKILNDVQSQEIPKISKALNDFFLEMIKSDPDPKKGGIIKQAKVTSEYDIKVSGPQNKELNPDLDLNGASKRALTLSFILALTKVSEFVAPNVIDTPLGMMDPMIKKSVLKTCVEHSNQLILFLTRTEIANIEKILDKAYVTTIINAAHYPKRLANESSKDYVALACSCDHRHYCDQCEYIGDKGEKRLKKV